MPSTELSIEQLLDRRGDFWDLRLLAGRSGLSRTITNPRVQKQGLVLVGVVDAVRPGRLQILGQTELDFMASLDEEARLKACEALAASRAAALLITNGQGCPKDLARACEQHSMAVLGSRQASSEAINAVQERLDEVLSARTSIHGVLLDVWGQGVLVLGKSGIGKSECALSLVARGHRLVADDMVEILQAGTSVVGRGGPSMQHMLEIRGLGIVDVFQLYGVAAVRDLQRVDMVVELAVWREGMQVDRLGLDEQFYTLLNVELPYVMIPVRPGRDLATMIEVAARNQLLRAHQIHSAQDFSQRLTRQVERNYLRQTGGKDGA